MIDCRNKRAALASGIVTAIAIAALAAAPGRAGAAAEPIRLRVPSTLTHIVRRGALADAMTPTTAAQWLECMRLSGTRRMVQISSEEVYGHFSRPVIDEEHPRNPIGAYGISKLAAEQLARSHAERHGLECINVRTSWVYGPGLPRDRVPRNLLAAAASRTRRHLPSGADFAVDHTYVDDFVAGVLAALDHPRHRFDAYHVASGAAATVGEIVEILRELEPGADLAVGPGAHLHGPGVPAVAKGALDVSRARDELGYRPSHALRSGLERCLEAMRR